ncbi:2TM domain-containing protein [Zunongwangia sp.]|uniref:2TM domain-containing protein n=1 Tax=Zunongwangia sp. TaxID=1965325 RepID=UPI003AA837DF
MEIIDKENRYFEAKKRVKDLRDFYVHLFIYVIINGFLAYLNFKDGFDTYPWMLWPLTSWGIGLLFNAVRAFRINPGFSKEWEKRKIEQILEEEQTQQRWE